MKGFLFILLIAFIVCNPKKSFAHASKEEKIERQKMMKERLIKCIYENGSEELIEFVKKNEKELRKAIGANKDTLKKEDLRTIRDCKLKNVRERHEEMKKETGL